MIRKDYEEPEIQFRSYKLPSGNVIMTSDGSSGQSPNLEDGDHVTYPYFN
jgi:hypothetical protein